MRDRFAYGGPEGEPFELPDDRVRAVLRPVDGQDLDLDALVERAVEAPVAAPRLRDLFDGARSVLLLVDDFTRKTPVARILPHVARELTAAGVEDERVTVLTAQGTHRLMSRDELEAKVGAPVLARWRVEQHDWRDASSLVRIGETASGMPVVVNRLMQAFDVIVGIGHVGVHGNMGYSGGAKIVLPGVAGASTEASTHWRASLMPEAELMGVLETPLRRDIEEGARMAGLDAVVNVVLDHRGAVQHAACGDFVAVQRECARVARDLSAAHLAAPADVVVVEARPADRDYWQAIKGLYAATLAVRDGGTVVLVSPCPEGVAQHHPIVRELAGLALDEVRRRVAAGEVEDVIGAAVAALTARMRERFHVILVSSGIPPDEAARLGFAHAPRASEGVAQALRRAGRDASVVVMHGGGSLLPLVKGRNRRLVEQSFSTGASARRSVRTA